MVQLALYCPECKLRPSEFHAVDLVDGAIYDALCPSGHATRHFLHNHKFEILFESAVLAFADGYTREAVASLAAATEEFFRFYVKTVLTAKGFYTQRPDEVKSLWRLVSLSERQLGAFAVLFLLQEGHAPDFPDQKTIEFRNDVIHKGRIPRREEVAQFGDKIVAFIVPHFRKLLASSDAVLHAVLENLPQLRPFEGKPPINSMHIPTALGVLASSAEVPSFAAAVHYAENNSMFRRE